MMAITSSRNRRKVRRGCALFRTTLRPCTPFVRNRRLWRKIKSHVGTAGVGCHTVGVEVPCPRAKEIGERKRREALQGAKGFAYSIRVYFDPASCTVTKLLIDPPEISKRAISVSEAVNLQTNSFIINAC